REDHQVLRILGMLDARLVLISLIGNVLRDRRIDGTRSATAEREQRGKRQQRQDTQEIHRQASTASGSVDSLGALAQLSLVANVGLAFLITGAVAERDRDEAMTLVETPRARVALKRVETKHRRRRLGFV